MSIAADARSTCAATQYNEADADRPCAVARQQALQALEEVIPAHLRGDRHGVGFLGERYALLRQFILQTRDGADAAA